MNEERAQHQAKIDLYQDLGADYTQAYATWINDLLAEHGFPKDGREITFTDEGDLIVTAPGHRAVFHGVIHPDLEELGKITDG